MTAGSDLDLMTLYRADDGSAMSALKGWSADVFFARFTQRLIAALSAQTGEGGLYDVDMRLRPSGTAGPVAVSVAAFEHYYSGEAETWEFLAMTRARVVWATSPAFAEAVSARIEAVLRRPRDPGATARDVRAMRALLHKEKPASGLWDMKMSAGGLVDVEFAAQHLQLIHAGAGGPLRPHTAEALTAMAKAGLADPPAIVALTAAWRLQQDLSQVLKLAFDGEIDPAHEPKGFQAQLARAGGVRRFRDLEARLSAVRAAALSAFNILVATD
jgi:glutamate-ammonia-ligase adenylyltransferase